MSKNYKQLRLEQRYQIQALLTQGITNKEIAIVVGCHPSTISRELKRNVAKRGRGAKEYKASNAQRRTNLRHQEKEKNTTFSLLMKSYAAQKLLVEKFSPKLIEIEGKRKFGKFVSHETLYKWIWQMKIGNKSCNVNYKGLYKHLRHGRRRRKRGNIRDNRGVIPNRVSIEKRPLIVNRRKRLGDLEVDLMMGKNHKGAVLVMLDRASLFTKLVKLPTKESKGITKKIVGCWIKKINIMKTITFDNDKAFSGHELIAKLLKVKTYFTRPYTSQDKGSVENRIGVLRRFIPKKSDLSLITSNELMRIENLLNNRPIKKFNYKTPNQVFSERIALIS